MNLAHHHSSWRLRRLRAKLLGLLMFMEWLLDLLINMLLLPQAAGSSDAEPAGLAGGCQIPGIWSCHCMEACCGCCLMLSAICSSLVAVISALEGCVRFLFPLSSSSGIIHVLLRVSLFDISRSLDFLSPKFKKKNRRSGPRG